ncbi:hypothetical protein [Streptosporangium sandarakinum]
MGIRSFIFAERPDLHQQANQIFSADWPEFIFHDPVADQYMGRVREFFEDMSLLLVDGDDQIVAGGVGRPGAMGRHCRQAAWRLRRCIEAGSGTA